ncbi:conjugal transfer protein TraF [Pseudoroseomonas sp. WGS1072]|uniref:conjugal transfer protein TraF n=1 Tax=Roseomonas sp. WGS1072 TaxID=3366816 RepID=UPI003BF2B36A
MPPPTAGREWTQGGREGWFFYREIVEPDPEEEERRPEPAPQAIIPPPSPQPPPPGPQPEPAPAVSGPAPLSAAWFRERLEGYRDQAIDDPSPENVQAYLYLQRIMLDKTSRFTESYQQVVATNPDLDANAERPLAPFAASQVDRMAAQAQDALLQHIAQDTGILFVYRSDCVYCEQQAPILQMLERTHGLKILAVALDGKPMPNGAFPNFTRDAGQAAVLGVQRTPSLFLLRPPGDVVPVSQGVLALQALKERILGQARIAGWISEEAWQATRQVQSRSLANLADVLDPATLTDPAALVAAIRQHVGDAP